MAVSRPHMAELPPTRAAAAEPMHRAAGRQGLVVLGGILGAIAASSCCIVPLILFSLGVSGAWIGNLTALAPYKPLFLVGTAGLLGYGFYLVYRTPKQACSGETCTRRMPNSFVQLALWIATLIGVAAFAFDYIAPMLLDA